jgi:membrane-bound lytic murein transglycosylase F
MQVRQHIVSNRKNLTIKGVEDLGGKTAVVRKGTSYESRLRELQKEGIDIKIQTVTDSPTEQLIKRVASGDIEVTVADTHIALLNRKYYPQGIVGEAISETQNIAWGLNPEARKLRYSINSFLRTTKSNGTFDELYSRHFGGINDFDYVDLMRFHRRLKSRLPKYEKYIKDSADKYGFDWRLITAQAYQESHLRKWAQSSSGAYGIMQLLRRTARSLSVRNIFNPSQNINGGVKQLSKLYRHYQYVGSADDRLYISLASYNAGQGHILDAKKLAKRMGLNPNKWASLVQTLPLLQYKEFYKDAEYGFCRGEEPVKYVRQIVLYYDILKHLSVSNSGEIRLALKDTK